MAMLYKRQEINYQNMLQPNLLSEGRRVPHSAKMAAMGSTLAYIPLLPFFVRGRNRPLITTNYKFMNNS